MGKNYLAGYERNFPVYNSSRATSKGCPNREARFRPQPETFFAPYISERRTRRRSSDQNEFRIAGVKRGTTAHHMFAQKLLVL